MAGSSVYSRVGRPLYTIAGDVIKYIDAPVTPQNTEILSYLNSLKKEHGHVRRVDFNPMKVPAHLPTIYIVEALDGGQDFEVRLFGTGCVEVIGVDMTGKRLSNIRDAEWRTKSFREILKNEVFAFSITYVGNKVGFHRIIENLYAPMTDKNGELKYILVSFVTLPGRIDDYR